MVWLSLVPDLKLTWNGQWFQDGKDVAKNTIMRLSEVSNDEIQECNSWNRFQRMDSNKCFQQLRKASKTGFQEYFQHIREISENWFQEFFQQLRGEFQRIYSRNIANRPTAERDFKDWIPRIFPTTQIDCKEWSVSTLTMLFSNQREWYWRKYNAYDMVAGLYTINKFHKLVEASRHIIVL